MSSFLDNFELLKSLLAHASMGAGVVSDGWSRHLKAIQWTLMEIEKLHQEHMNSGTLKARDQFYSKRAVLFASLDDQLSKIASFGVSLRNKGSIKRTLGISTKSYLHAGEIAGYAKKVAEAGKAANLIKKGAYLGIALEVAATHLKIRKACALGREEACRKAKFVEISSLTGSLAGNTGGAIAGGLFASRLCIALKAPTRGLSILACGVMGGATGGMVGAEIGKEWGAGIGEFLYEKVEP